MPPQITDSLGIGDLPWEGKGHIDCGFHIVFSDAKLGCPVWEREMPLGGGAVARVL